MASSPNVQNSYGPEVTASEHMPYAAPQHIAPENHLYPVDNHNKYIPQTGFGETGPLGEKLPAKRICGLSPRVFWILVAVSIVALAGTAIGVGVGVSERGGDGSSDDNPPPADDTPTESSTPTSSAPVTSGTVGLAANSCDFFEPERYTAPDGTDFVQYCFTDWPLGAAAAAGQGTVSDVASTLSYTFEDCMGECLTHNAEAGDGDARCVGVSYISNLTDAMVERDLGANCWMKDRKGVDISAGEFVASAVIVPSLGRRGGGES